MFGYCRACDKYRMFEKDGDSLHCLDCNFDTPYDENDPLMVEAVEAPIPANQIGAAGTVTLEPAVLRTVSADNSLESVIATQPEDIAGYAILFKNELQSVVEWACEWKVSIPCIAVIETQNRSFSVATAILVHQDGSIQYYSKPKPASVVASTPQPVNYREYLQSQEWQVKRQEALKRAGYRCQVCNTPDRLEAHHRTYSNLGHELDGDITILCRECHELFFKFGRLARH